MIYFLSDAHLGSRVIKDGEAHQQRIISLLQSMAQDATEIYLLGDIFDFWYEYFWEKYPQGTEENVREFEERLPKGKKQYAHFLFCLRTLTRQGIRIHYFIGNHDIWTFGGLSKMTGVEVHREPMVVTLHNKTVMMGHGDGLIPSRYLTTLEPHIQRKIRSFIRLRKFFHSPIPQWFFRLVPPALGDRFGYEWARRSRQKELDNPFPYKGENQEELVLYAKEREQAGRHADYYIFGHRHIELDLQITKNSRVLILGDMFRQWTYAKMNEGELTIEICIHEKNN